MATKPSWITLSAASGSGNGTITATAAKHTGRENRTGTITFSGTGVGSNKTVSVTQTGAAVFATINDISITKAGGTIKITGQTNADGLLFSLVSKKDAGNNTDIVAWNSSNKGYDVDNPTATYDQSQPSDQYTVAGIPWMNGKTLTGGISGTSSTTQQMIETAKELGKASAYSFEISLTIAENTDNESITRKISIGRADTKAELATKEFVQPAGSATLTVSPTSLTFAAAGEGKDITVTSNTSWTVS